MGKQGQKRRLSGMDGETVWLEVKLFETISPIFSLKNIWSDSSCCRKISDKYGRGRHRLRTHEQAKGAKRAGNRFDSGWCQHPAFSYWVLGAAPRIDGGKMTRPCSGMVRAARVSGARRPINPRWRTFSSDCIAWAGSPPVAPTSSRHCLRYAPGP